MKVLFYRDMAYSDTVNLYRVRDMYPPRNHILPCPPAVNTMRERPIPAANSVRTRMCEYGWVEYLKKLNGKKFEAAVGPGYAMFNKLADKGAPFCDRDQMESLIFDRAWVLAIPAVFKDVTWWGWKQILTLPYTAGPPKEQPSYKENPLYVQKLTYQCRAGNMFARQRYYPVTCATRIFIEEHRLEPWSKSMTTPPPPIGAETIGTFLEIVALNAKSYLRRLF